MEAAILGVLRDAIKLVIKTTALSRIPIGRETEN
jgi:hypothetical protein